MQNGISLGNGIISYPNGSETTNYRSNLWVIANTTPGFLSGQSTYNDPTLIGWTYTVELIGKGPLDPGVDFNYLPGGGIEFIDYILQPGDSLIFIFSPQVVPTSATSGIASGQIYLCNTPITTPESFNPAHWTLLGNQYDMFYVQLPCPEFVYTNFYNIGDQVWWKDIVYKCIVPTPVLDHEVELQYATLSNVPYPNIFPDDPVNGSINWKNMGVYSVLGTSLLNPTLWTPGDNRNQQMVEYMMDTVIYRLYKRIAPKDIPKDRRDAYSIVLGWLKECARGDQITANLIKIQPYVGQRIRFGGMEKNFNSY
jgi:hypothetical protein